VTTNGDDARIAAGADIGGVNAGAKAVSLGDEVETGGLGGNQRSQVELAR
jgi:hypothetical protein